MEALHTPVLLRECLEYLGPGEGQESSPYLLIDATLGEGGHAEAFLKKYKDLRIIGLDADLKIQARARERLAPFGQRMVFYSVWFNDFFANFPIEAAPHGVLFDLGISLYHYEQSGRGFSFRADEPLDMRLDPESGSVSPADIVNGASEDALAEIIFAYGEERGSRRIARAIVTERGKSPIRTASHLARVVWDAVPAGRRPGIHPATRTFQALRIAVNNELERLGSALVDSFNVLAPGGKMCVISFHSLEDRITKNFFRSASKQCICPSEQPKCICGGACAELLVKKAVVADGEEKRANAPSRSAKMRALRKTGEMNGYRKTLIKTETHRNAAICRTGYPWVQEGS
jgi:16S rRNA (cytosine1402-N4)-methyltransferase